MNTVIGSASQIPLDAADLVTQQTRLVLAQALHFLPRCPTKIHHHRPREELSGVRSSLSATAHLPLCILGVVADQVMLSFAKGGYYLISLWPPCFMWVYLSAGSTAAFQKQKTKMKTIFKTKHKNENKIHLKPSCFCWLLVVVLCFVFLIIVVLINYIKSLYQERNYKTTRKKLQK